MRLFRRHKKEKAAGICPIQIDIFRNKKGLFNKRIKKAYSLPSMYKKD